MAEDGFNLFKTKRAARREAWRANGPGTDWNPFSKTFQRTRVSPALVPDDDSVNGRGPKVTDVVTRPSIKRISLDDYRGSIPQDTNDFNHSNSILQNVEELYWDPLGELSSHSGAEELAVSTKFATTVRTESREEVLIIDMHVLELVNTGKMYKIVLKDTEELSEYLKQTSGKQQPTRFYFLQDVSVHASPIVSRLLGCSIDIFRDHFKRASDDVAFMLPSRSCKQDHAVIPYQRC